MTEALGRIVLLLFNINEKIYNCKINSSDKGKLMKCKIIYFVCQHFNTEISLPGVGAQFPTMVGYQIPSSKHLVAAGPRIVCSDPYPHEL